MENDWENYLISLPDSAFFEILKNYFGDIKTPFNKHNLIRRLNDFIAKKEIKNRILNLIDDDDARILTAITIFHQPDIEKLHLLTKRFYSFLELHNRIENLQQRLLICVIKDSDKKSIISVSPVFKDEITTTLIDTNLIFPSLTVQKVKKYPWVAERIMPAFLSFIFHNEGSKKKIELLFSKMFNISHKDNVSELIDFLKNQSAILGFARIENNIIKEIFWENLKNYAIIESSKREIIFIASAIGACLQLQEIPLHLLSFLETFFSELEEGTRIHYDELIIFINLLNDNTEKKDDILPKAEKIIKALLFCGFAVKDNNTIIICKNQKNGENLPVTIQANFEITVPTSASLLVETEVAECCELIKYNVHNNYELTKSSFSLALDCGLKAETIIENLKKASNTELPQNLVFTLQAWNKEYSSIMLNYGIVLSVEKTRIALVEHSKELKNYIISQIAPGVFLFDHKEEESWRKVLKEIGFDIIPATNGRDQNNGKLKENNYENMSFSPSLKIIYKKTRKSQSKEITREILAKTNSINLKKGSKDQLEAKIRKKLILDSSLITSLDSFSETREAGGVDHRAKIRLASSAIELGNLLEINTVTNIGIESRMIKPLKLLKEEAESPNKPIVYTIQGIELPSESKVFIPITKISYLKILKNSLFSP